MELKLSTQQTKELAVGLCAEIKDYIATNPEAYQAFLAKKETYTEGNGARTDRMRSAGSYHKRGETIAERKEVVGC